VILVREQPVELYVIENLLNGKKYVGLSKDAQWRWKTHKRAIVSNRGSPLYSALRKYGVDVFKFTALGSVDGYGAASQMEKKLIAGFGTRAPHGYNLTDGGEGLAGYAFSEEALAKIRSAFKGRKHTDESRAKMSASLTGKTHTAEAKAKISEGNKGKTVSDASRAKMSASQKKAMTAERRQLIRDQQLGSKASDETRAKMSASHKQVTHTVEWAENISKGLKGKKKSPEHCEAMKASSRRRWDRVKVEKLARLKGDA
jgi:group I intron endonuclease